MRYVLLLEENEYDRLIFPILLKKSGLKSIVANNIKEATLLVNESERYMIDAMIISSDKIERKELEFAQGVMKSNPSIKVVATSCRHCDDQICKSFGITFVLKPITSMEKISKALLED